MILEVSSDIETFKTIRFRRGLNIVLADVSAQSTDGHTRNSAGKSSLVEIIHFLLGSNIDKWTLFSADPIRERSFSGVVRVGGRIVSVTRRCGKPQRVLLSRKHAGRLNLALQRDEATGEYFVHLEDWKSRLGAAWFGLPLDPAGTPFAASHAPTFRQLIGFFARRSREIGFAYVDRFFAKQQPGVARVSLSYLLGLDWEIPRAIQELNDRKKALGSLRKAIKAGDLGTMFASSAKIRPELGRVEALVERLRRQIESFEVHQSYRELADEAASIKVGMSSLALDLSNARETLKHLERLIAHETPPDYASVSLLYESAGIELPNVVMRRLDEMDKFQRSVVANRNAYMAEQVDEARIEIIQIERELTASDRRRAEILRTLQGKGAYEDFMRLQGELGQATSRAETLRHSLQNANILENKSTALKKDSADLQMRLQTDYAQREDAIRSATQFVDQVIAKLYDDRTGDLVIEPTKDGPIFTLNIDGGGNQGGINSMKIFCFDLMLFERTSARLGGPGFLIHDSHLFDGVDERQARAALVLGGEAAARSGGQYIVTLNSDEFDKVGPDGLEAAVLDQRLTDDEKGGLFGFRFELPAARRK